MRWEHLSLPEWRHVVPCKIEVSRSLWASGPLPKPFVLVINDDRAPYQEEEPMDPSVRMGFNAREGGSRNVCNP